MEIDCSKNVVWKKRDGGIWIGSVYYSRKRGTIEIVGESGYIIDRICSSDINNNKTLFEIYNSIPPDVTDFTLRDACE